MDQRPAQSPSAWSPARISTVAIIASFRRMMEEVATARAVFADAGLRVTSPLHDEPLDPGVEFVRFVSDQGSDPYIQSVALHRIMGADLVYVVATDGYVGRTTCYEIGRISQAGRPMVFSDAPKDLPIHVAPATILSPEQLVARIDANAGVLALPDNILDNDTLESDLRDMTFRSI